MTDRRGAARHNLPIPLTSFVGRERETVEVGRLLAGTRLLTLTGAGGCGKSRLALQTALQVAHNEPGRFPDGVWAVELVPLSDPRPVPQAVALALGVPEQPRREPADSLADYLRPRSLLLVLDNCEHLLIACAHLAEAMLRTCPGLRILATSREAFGVPGETIWRVPSLSLPDTSYRSPPDQLMRYEAVRLFVERAAAVRPEFRMTAGNAALLSALQFDDFLFAPGRQFAIVGR